jgi:oligopeptide transport system permease protein
MTRGGYIIRRILLLIPTLLAIYTLTFLLIHATPGGPFSQGEKPVPKIVLRRLNEAYGLDKPLWRQYVNYLWNVLHGDFGPSYTSRSRTVADIVGSTFPISLKLGLVAMALAVTAGVTLGTIGAIRHNSWLDYLTGFVAIVGVSTKKLPVTTSARMTPETVITGNSELRRACRAMTVEGRSPFARAVRT